MSNKINKKVSKEIIDISKLNINNKLSGGVKKKELESEPEPEPELESESESLSSEEEDVSDESNIDEQVSSEDDRDIDEEEQNEEQETEIEESDKDVETETETDADEKTNKDSDNESKDDEDNDDATKDKCYHKYSKKSNMDTDIDYDEYFIKDEEITINKTGKLTKPYLTKYERVRILGDRSRQLAQGAKPMIKNTTGLSHKEVALLELKNKVIPLIIERPIPNVGVEKWKLSELEINL
jgi:DNA-directed RNA polymerase I, II, and III subunit RPABC2